MYHLPELQLFVSLHGNNTLLKMQVLSNTIFIYFYLHTTPFEIQIKKNVLKRPDFALLQSLDLVLGSTRIDFCA